MPLVTKKDYLLVVVIGFLFGLLVLPIISNIQLSFLEVNLINAFLIVTGFMILAAVALWVASLISRIIPVMLQFAKFGAVGGLNTVLDLGILNTLMFFTGIAAGGWFSVFKGVSFIIATINSYFWNKHWTFGVGGAVNTKEFGTYLIVSVVGFGINIGISSLIVNIVGPIGEISPERWANIGAFTATIMSLMWNFIGYKFIVFKKQAGA